MITGMLGPDNGGLTVEQGYDAARHCGLNIIATLKKQLGDLDRVEQVVKVCTVKCACLYFGKLIPIYFIYQFTSIACTEHLFIYQYINISKQIYI